MAFLFKTSGEDSDDPSEKDGKATAQDAQEALEKAEKQLEKVCASICL
jgi:hypothetical protein